MRERPCCRCEKRAHCNKMCDKWVNWFRLSWREVRRAGKKMGGALNDQ